MTSTSPGAEAVPGRTPVMADVARLAGVSLQTVSRVVNGLDNLRPETRHKVEAAISQLGYRPNRAARSLVTRRSATIGVIGSRSGLWGPSTIHRSVQAAGRDAGYFVSSVNLPAFTHHELTDAIEHLRDQHVEGIVLIAAHDAALEVAREQRDGGTPVVVVEGDEAQARWSVGVDQVAGGRMATEHLLAQGHRSVLHLAGPQAWNEARGRLAGWRAAMEAAGLPAPAPYEGDWSPESGYRLGLRIREERTATAVFCANDQMALGLVRALWEAGRSVPDDLSVVGFDDVPESAYFLPPLTTVRQDFPAVGRLAITTLSTAIAGEPAPARLIAPELVVRRSTAPRTLAPSFGRTSR